MSSIQALRMKAVNSSNGPAPPVVDTKIVAKEIANEVDERTRNGSKAFGEHCDRLVVRADELAQHDAKITNFVPTPNTVDTVHATVYLKAKTLKRLLAKLAVLADLVQTLGMAPADNMAVWHDQSWRSETEITMKPDQAALSVDEMLKRMIMGGDGAEGMTGAGQNQLANKQTDVLAGAGREDPDSRPIMIPVDTAEVARDKISSITHSQKLLHDGSLYKGELRDGRPHGFGSLTYASSDPKRRTRFSGDFIDGIRVGAGCISWMDGTHYAGDWYGDRPSGFGLEVYPDGSSYVGQFLDDHRSGYGVYKFPSEAKYEGCWELGIRSGIALQHSKRGITAATFKEGSKVSSKDYMPGQSEEFDSLPAKVKASVERGRQRGETALRAYERYFQVKISRGNLAKMSSGRETGTP